GKLLGTETVQGGSGLTYKYSASDVSVASGYVFRGWFNSDKSTASKVAEGASVQSNLNLYAKVTEKEVCSQTARFIYDLSKANFYDEDHECIDMTGKYHGNHGWVFSNGQTISFPVAGKAVIAIANCAYSAEADAVVTDAAGNTVATFSPKASTDGAETSFKYDGEATTLTITFGATAYVHKVSVFNVVDFVSYDETSGYYVIPANDVNSFLLALTEANAEGNKRIFLPDGYYDMGETVLTAISGSNISIIGQSIEKTIIRNAPLAENEGIGTTAIFLITGSNTYFQDLTLTNELDYYSAGSAGRAVCIQDKGTGTICKNVKMLSYQDTYYSNNNNGQFYWEDSEIHGCVDYICGGGTAYFNRCLLVNESRKKGDKNGEATITAPNGNTTYGYVFNQCTVENLAASFNFGRAWNDKPRCAYINTTLNQPDEIIANRWTVKGMNVYADKFVEYNTVDASGNVVSPASNILEFSLGSNTNKMETILTEDQAADYALDKVFTSWDPATIAAQQSISVAKAADAITWTSDADIYAVFSDDVFVTFTTEKSYTPAATDGDITVRAANARGGLCPAASASDASNAISRVEAADL
ncbi:pectinesterase family protein, partial [Salmonella enterica]|nr:pectinesterase family protein [Salmonella enterica]